MVCLGLEPGAAGWKRKTNPLNYGGIPHHFFVDEINPLNLVIALPSHPQCFNC